MIATDVMYASTHSAKPARKAKIEPDPPRRILLQRLVLDELRLALHAALKLVVALLIVEGLVWLLAAGRLPLEPETVALKTDSTPSATPAVHTSAEFAATVAQSAPRSTREAPAAP